MSRSERTRAEILEAAWKLFEASGSQAVRIQDVADAADVTRQTVYFHFDNRASLLVAVARYVDEQVHRLPDRAEPVWESASARAAVTRFVELVADYYPTIHDITSEIHGMRTIDEDVDAAWRDRMESRKAACRGLVEWLRRDGDLIESLDDDDATDLLTTLTSFGTWEDLTVYQDRSRAGYVRLVSHALGRTLLAQ